MQTIEADPGARPELWQGAVRWTQVPHGWQPWRLLPGEEALSYAPDLFRDARYPAGVRFVADLTPTGPDARAELSFVCTFDEEDPRLDVLVDGERVLRQPVRGPSRLSVELPQQPCRLEVWLPQSGETQVGRLTLTGVAGAEPVARRVRWATYGSSITRCRTAAGPSETWPAIVARTNDWDLTCLGFGGQCHLDAVVERTLAAVEADVISLCLGINIYGGATFSARTLPGRLAAFVQAVRAAHPTTPLLVMSPIVSPPREETPNDVGLTLADVRDLVMQVATDLLRAGDDRLWLLDGRDVFGSAEATMLPDDLHPDADGYRLMGQRLARVLAQLPR